MKNFKSFSICTRIRMYGLFHRTVEITEICSHSFQQKFRETNRYTDKKLLNDWFDEFFSVRVNFCNFQMLSLILTKIPWKQRFYKRIDFTIYFSGDDAKNDWFHGIFAKWSNKSDFPQILQRNSCILFEKHAFVVRKW